MKKKVALLLALVMVMAMLPMNVFGAVRAGTVLNPQLSPQWGLQSFTFRIDAAAFSNLSPGVIQFAMLDFQLSGGASSNAVGFASRAALNINFTAGPGFRVNNDVSQNAAFLASLNAASTAGSGNREFFDYTETLAYENWLDVNSGRTPRHLNVLGQSDTGVWGGLLGGSYDAAAGTVTAIPATGVRYSATRLMVDLLGGDPARLNNTVEGFIDVQIDSIRPDAADATMAIYLRTGGNNIMHVPVQLANVPLVGDWGNGVVISSRSVVPMAGIAQLSGIRITEAIPGRLMTNDATVAGNFDVRLVAPRGFVWDTGALVGIVPRALEVELNSAIGTPSNPTISLITLPGNAANPHLNPSTDRSELYLRISHAGRGGSFVNRTTTAEFTITGLTLIPVRGAASSGNVAIDAFIGSGPANSSMSPPAGFNADQMRATDNIVGTTGSWGRGFLMPHLVTSTSATPIPTFTDHMGSFWSEHNSGGSNWRNLGLVVASLDATNDIEVVGPTAPANVISGRLTNGELTNSFFGPGFGVRGNAFSNINIAGNPRWLHGSSHTIRLQEVTPGTLFRNFDTFELRPVQEGVRIVDARAQAGREGAVDTNFAWRGFENDASFIGAITDFTGESLIFAPRTIDAESQSRLRRMDIGLLLSIEAGFEAKYGEAVEIEVFRNGVSIGIAHVANASDLIRVVPGPETVITRNAFDVLALTQVSSFSIEETEAGAFRSGDTFRIGLRAIQNGREVNAGNLTGMGTMALTLGLVEFNEAESGIVVEAVRGQDNTFRVVRGSYDVPGVIEFQDVYLAGPSVPGLEWHVVVFGPEISANHEEIILPPVASELNNPAAPTGQEASPVGYRSVWEQRAIFYTMPFHAQVLDVRGTPVIGSPGYAGGAAGPGGTVTTSFTLATRDIEGHPALHFERIGAFNVSMFGARMFADFIGAAIDFEGAGVGQTVTLTGNHAATGAAVEVVLTVGSNMARVNGNNVDIAYGSNQPALQNQISPVNVGGRVFVPGRFLANAFGVAIDFQGAGDNMTVILG
ncbi:MAG: copper amine oxidase N-terminal domain-containing protein [Defluviitaleaceae bacterium]|nr:copper amine oxidase N-terminal domain-containing protein [Defluviitaleaceae bacterium]